MPMYLLQLQSKDPAYNLALEEILLKEFEEPICLLWRDEKAVIIGKHQNASAEINHEFVAENKIDVCRRVSGGGTVFHDDGNVNFSFIANVEKSRSVDYTKWTQPILDCLNAMGIPAVFSGKSDLRIGEKKISGNAIYIFRNRIIHHGTLLYNSQLPLLRKALASSHEQYTGRSVASLRTSVTNIIDHHKEKMSTEVFMQSLANGLQEKFDARPLQINDMIHEQANMLAESKYRSWEWNFANSPKSIFKQTTNINGADLEVELDLQKGRIQKAKLHCDAIAKEKLNDLSLHLEGVAHNWNEVKESLHAFDFSGFSEMMHVSRLIKAFF